MHVCVWHVCVHVFCIWMLIYEGLERSELNFQMFSSIVFPPYFGFAGLAVQQAPGIHLSFCFAMLGCISSHPAFTWVLEIRTQVLILTWQAFYPLSHISKQALYIILPSKYSTIILSEDSPKSPLVAKPRKQPNFVEVEAWRSGRAALVKHLASLSKPTRETQAAETSTSALAAERQWDLLDVPETWREAQYCPLGVRSDITKSKWRAKTHQK